MFWNRHAVNGLRIIASAMAFLAGGALADVPSRAGPFPINLGADDIYRRDGALVDMKTCLAVADDLHVPSLLSHPLVEEVWDLPPIDRAAAMQRLSQRREQISKRPDVLSLDQRLLDNVGLRHGYGTLLACSQIVAAWHSSTLMTDDLGRLLPSAPQIRPNDGRVEHGTLVIDLGIGEGQRAFIEPVPLARLMTSPGLVPPSVYGGIVIRNAIVNRTLKLHSLRLIEAVSFVNVKFAGRSYSREIFKDSSHLPATALSITHAQIDGHLTFIDTEFCGSVIIDHARFSDTLSIQGADQFMIGCSRAPLETSKIALRVENSRFEQNLILSGARFAASTFSGVTVDGLTAEMVDFGRELSLSGSDLGSVEIACSFLSEEARFLSNHITKNFRITGTDLHTDRECSHLWPFGIASVGDRQVFLEVAHNKIGGGLSLSGLVSKRVKSPIRLVSNRVGAKSKVVIPGFWREVETEIDAAAAKRPMPLAKWDVWTGDIDMMGSTYQGTLDISLPYRPGKSRQIEVTKSEFCEAIGGDNKLKGTAIDLRAVRARILRWDLPLNCNFRWLGYGLTYDLWLKGGVAKASLGAAAEGVIPADLDHLALKAWRRSLRYYDAPSLNTMSQYLAGNGQYVDSREVLLEAKRLNYASTCPPDSNSFACAGELGAGLLASASNAFGLIDGAVAADATGDQASAGVPQDFSTVLRSAGEWLWRLFMLIMLWPGGYGAQPERALSLLVGVFFVCWAVYSGYTWYMRRKLLAAWDDIEAFIAENRYKLGNDTETPARWRQLNDDQASFIFDHHAAGGGRSTKNGWAGEVTDEDKLRELQGPLLSAVRAWEKDAYGDELKKVRGFRARIEAFGNTGIPGFGRFDANKMPKRFSHGLYSFDTMIPLIDLHGYSNYYPIAKWMRTVSILQHVAGWWWVTVFIASAAIL